MKHGDHFSHMVDGKYGIQHLALSTMTFPYRKKIKNLRREDVERLYTPSIDSKPGPKHTKFVLIQILAKEVGH